MNGASLSQQTNLHADTANGTSVDWVHNSTTIDIAYTIELRPTVPKSGNAHLDRFSLPRFCLPREQIDVTTQEVIAGMTALHEQVEGLRRHNFDYGAHLKRQSKTGALLHQAGKELLGLEPENDDSAEDRHTNRYGFSSKDSWLTLTLLSVSIVILLAILLLLSLVYRRLPRSQ